MQKVQKLHIQITLTEKLANSIVLYRNKTFEWLYIKVAYKLVNGSQKYQKKQ